MEGALGVYICRGCEIGEAVDVEELAGIAVKEFRAGACKTHDLLCGPDGIALIQEDIRRAGLSRIVVVGCSPRVKWQEFRFPGSLTERVNIRELVAWSQPAREETTQALARDYLRMGIVKAQKTALGDPYLLEGPSRAILVIGGGITGMSAALGAADAGYPVILVEKTAELGGWAARLHRQVPRESPFEDLEEPSVGRVREAVRSHPRIEVLTSSEVGRIAGAPGQFQVSVRAPSGPEARVVGAIVLAGGWRPYDASRLHHLGYGESPDVLTGIQLEELARQGRITRPSDGKVARRVAFILCAGSRDPNHLPYCSSFCCLASLKQAAYVVGKNPDSMAYILYKDIRTPGQYELFYRKMQDAPGVMLVKADVTGVSKGPDGNLYVDAQDTLLGERIRIEVDLVVLATGMVPNTRIEPEALSAWKRESAERLLASGITPDPDAPVEPQRVPNLLHLEYRQGPELPGLDEAYGFADSNYVCFQYETRRTGIYAAGSIRQPMGMLSCVEDGMGASMKAIQCVEAIARGYSVHPRAWDRGHPEVFLQRCTACKRCTEECPFGAIDEDERAIPHHKITRCRRCGTCLGSCPERLISFKDFHIDMISSMFKKVEVPEEELRLVGLVCENDAYPALDTAGIRRQRLHPAIRFLPVRCLGALNLVWITDALARGIDGMILLGCKYGENYQCHFVTGSELANYRLGKLHETLNKLRLEAERVQFVQASIADYDRLPAVLEECVRRIERIGANPFKEC
jgi:quinone-modifying oxidoreductase subunit QmoB